MFARLGDWGVLGQVNLTLEALVYGAVFALRLLVVGLACLLAVCAADPDQLLGSCRRLSPRVAPQRHRRAAPGARARRRRRPPRRGPALPSRRPRAQAPAPASGSAVLRATVAGALERSLDVAAVLEMRGYPLAAAGARAGSAAARATTSPSPPRPPRSRCWRSAARSPGPRPSTAYPLVSAPLDPAVVALALALPALALAPFLDRAGIEP